MEKDNGSKISSMVQKKPVVIWECNLLRRIEFIEYTVSQCFSDKQAKMAALFGVPRSTLVRHRGAVGHHQFISNPKVCLHALQAERWTCTGLL